MIPPGWIERRGGLERTYRFGSFREAWAFMSRVAALAEAADHHPDWRNSYGRVDIRLTTHEAGRITERDVALARRINETTEEDAE